MRVLLSIGYLSILLLGFASHSLGQAIAPASEKPVDDRTQDHLMGPVRRIRTETAKVTIRNGNLVEEPRITKRVVTYNIRGTRVDSSGQPETGSDPLKRQYILDGHGNVIEMKLLADNGSLLSKESYHYVFDAFGNWIKMTSSVEIYENGKVSFEPTEVTYRTISYFYNQAVANLATTMQDTKATAPAKVASSTQRSNKRTASVRAVQTFPKFTKVNLDSARDLLPDPPTTPPAEVTEATERVGLNLNLEEAPLPPAPLRKVSAKRITEDVLRSAAVTLPQPDFPMAAELASRNQKVLVQVAVNESGAVTSAHGTAPEAILNEAAEAAALKARFDPAKLADTPIQIFSVLTYDLAPTAHPQTDSSGSSTSAEVDNTTKPATRGGFLPTTDDTASSSRTAGASKSNLYEAGVALLNQGRFAEAETTLGEFVYRNPEDAAGYSKLGLAYAALKKNTEAVAALKMAISVNPNHANPEALYLLGVSYNNLQRYSEGAASLKQSLAMVNKQESREEVPSVSLFAIHYNLGVSYQGLSRSEDAIKEFKEAISLNPKAAQAYYALGVAQLAGGDRKGAEKQIEALKNLNANLARKLTDMISNRNLLVAPGCSTLFCP